MVGLLVVSILRMDAACLRPEPISCKNMALGLMALGIASMALAVQLANKVSSTKKCRGDAIRGLSSR